MGNHWPNPKWNGVLGRPVLPFILCDEETRECVLYCHHGLYKRNPVGDIPEVIGDEVVRNNCVIIPHHCWTGKFSLREGKKLSTITQSLRLPLIALQSPKETISMYHKHRPWSRIPLCSLTFSPYNKKQKGYHTVAMLCSAKTESKGTAKQSRMPLNSCPWSVMDEMVNFSKQKSKIYGI